MVKIILLILVILVASLEYLSDSRSSNARKNNQLILSPFGSQIALDRLATQVNEMTADNHSENSDGVALETSVQDTEIPTSGPGITIFDFSGIEPRWYTLNDDVMGGISDSSVFVDPVQQRLTFSGDLSLANNGGFASIRSQWAPLNLEDFAGVAMRVRGDGNVYRFRVLTEETGAEVAYTAKFATEAGQWQETYIPFVEMAPLFRGYLLPDIGPLNPASIRSFGLMVSDEQEGPFSLEVDWINAVTTKKFDYHYAEKYQEPSFAG